MTDLSAGWTLYWEQLGAMLVRNVLLKTREKFKLLAELVFPLYTLGILVIIKYLIPNPNFPSILEPRSVDNIFNDFAVMVSNNSISIVPNNSTEVYKFLENVNDYWYGNERWNRHRSKIKWLFFNDEEQILNTYWNDPLNISIAIIFENENPISDKLSYQIRTNPTYGVAPSTSSLFSTPVSCRQVDKTLTIKSSLLIRETGADCPASQYYYSYFIQLQMLFDYTKIHIDNDWNINSYLKDYKLTMFPKNSYTGNWIFAVRIVIPLYMVMTLSQFTSYLLILIVGEKESKIKEHMKIMGLNESIYWISWFIIYGIYVTILSCICTFLLFILKVFQHSNMFLIFTLITIYSYTLIMFCFLLTSFFDKASTAGILGNFIVNVLSALYFIQIFIKSNNSWPFWLVSLISPSGFALAMDKAVLNDFSGIGLNLNNIWQGDGVPFAGSLIMMLIDIILYGFLAFYLDAVLPSEYGVKRKPWFCFMIPCLKSQKSNQNNITLQNIRNHTFDHDNVESVPQELTNKEAIDIRDLYKSFKGFRQPEVTSINGFNLKIYEDQITAILGHNGAGKTTLFNILTGMTAPTSGSVYIFGYDIRNYNDLKKIRKMIGICPQHDILFDNLTLKEHLRLFATLRGLGSNRTESEIVNILEKIGLSEKADWPVKKLSGGQKRKLSVGVTIIGEPKIVILDEPTAGIDPYSRRQMWQFLQSYRHGKVILLTTHFMDEADFLSDRKAVIWKGQLQCCGSSLFLKNKFGCGYYLTLDLSPRNNNSDKIVHLVKKFVPDAEKGRHHGNELSIVLPYDSASSFGALFNALEAEIRQGSDLGVCSYGISMTTLEEVFLQLDKSDDTDTDLVLDRKLLNSCAITVENRNYSDLETFDSTTDSVNSNNDNDSFEMKPTFGQSLQAILYIRYLILIRDCSRLYFTIVVPMIFATIGLYLNSIQINDLKPQLVDLSTDFYGFNNTGLLIHMELNETTNSQLILETFKVFARVKIFNGDYLSILNQEESYIAALNVTSDSITIIYNDTFIHCLPIVINIMNKVQYLLTSGKNISSVPISVQSNPLMPTTQPNEIDVGVCASALFLGMVFVIVPSSLAVDIVYDREIKIKNLLQVNGISHGCYFLSYLIILGTLFSTICIFLVILMIILNLNWLKLTAPFIVFMTLIIIYCPVSVLFVACLSYLFSKTESASSLMPNLAAFTGLLPFLLVMLLDAFQISTKTAIIFHYVFSVTNTAYIPYAMVYFINRVYITCDIQLKCDKLSLLDYMIPEILVMLFSLILHAPLLWFGLYTLDETKNWSQFSPNSLYKLFWNKVNNNSYQCSEQNELEDDDVRVEREKVINCLRNLENGKDQPVVLVHNLRKEYNNKKSDLISRLLCQEDNEESNSKIAVKNLSLAIDYGEVFGLLGHNGAGKTTTMRILTSEELQSNGTVIIGGRNLSTNSWKSSKGRILGYCPQFDCLWKTITIKEHLECYAAIRGIPSKHINRVVNNYIRSLKIKEHANKQSQFCSGGTKRKLSFAIAMIGDTDLILLDEPSTGMDPKSKRFLWDTILRYFNGKRAAVLTTHSMEEVDALCTRIGIMVNGELRCIGTTQHLKNLYGAGYRLEMKFKSQNQKNIEFENRKHQELNNYITNLFPTSKLDEYFIDRLVFSIPQDSVKTLAKVFEELEQAKIDFDIEEYSFSQTTLDQVFLQFSHCETQSGSDL